MTYLAKLYLTVGITGHRDLVEEDIPLLKKRIKDVFDDLRKEYPNTPLLLITPLAEGADRLAAEVALEENIEYVSPLPLPINIYKNDFPDTVSEFDHYISNAKDFFELPLGKDKIESISKYGKERDKRYQLVGAFIVRYSQVLVALWDGKHTSLTGGTSDIIRFQSEGLPHEYATNRCELDFPDSGPVYHILTRRRKNIDISVPYNAKVNIIMATEGKKKEGGVFRIIDRTAERLFHNDHFKKGDTAFRPIDNFNFEAEKLTIKDADKSLKYLTSLKDFEKEKDIAYLYANADALSLKHQKKWLFSQKLLFVITGLIVTDFIIYSFINIRYLLVFYITLYILAAFIIARYHKNRESYINYRSLAEGLRVVFFLRFAGLHEDAADNYLSKQAEELQWVREAMRSANVIKPKIKPDFEMVQKDWINGQIKYYTGAKARDQKKLTTIRTITIILLLLGFISAVLALIKGLTGILPPLNLLIAMTALMPAYAAILETYSVRMGFTEHIKEYSRMQGIFERANKLLKNSKDVESRQRIFLMLGREALRENADWLLLHRKLPEGLPKQ
ncbi:MAG: hypothetical protein EVJ47_03110 [Candidatus Acidulodesulfobacterium ferriphilum]|uniref:SMODS and SLOG-associating 2TM effector domain-containing protein n=1 Tax=Candidatus Acidulodesulfobacterium ferriphilum TaxID=2597223 RepID=A0A519BDC7_9DELT|nr:MAG: hypothetical protein EVJ47_03110 [Candidatus Acidulodesulfobacterium ferriphilum]